jgi:hypothetical protein
MSRWKYGLAAGVACAALASSWLWAQPVVQNTLSGNECWNAGNGPGGPTVGFICSFQTRSSWNYYLSNAAVVPGNAVQLTPQQNAVIMSAQITPTATTFNLPAVGSGVTDGQIVSFCNVTNAAFATTAVTITATAPQVFATGATTTLTTLAARTCVKLIYTASNTTWSQVQ